jgi:hypothetical protein
VSDQQARLSGSSRGCRPLERSVVDDLRDLLSEPNPLPEIKASVATALTPYGPAIGATAMPIDLSRTRRNVRETDA